ncbi:MAG TPA: hypothetical protein VF377_06535 [Acidimicrobiia bacterium]|jgi:hypothetical protein
MLTSIHPLGERARDNRWAITVTAYVIGAVAAGTAVGAGLGWLGSLLPGGDWRWAGAVFVVGVAGLLDLVKIKPPGLKRQVNEDWIGTYRGWVYGGGFGAQLGVGVSTFVVTWGTWATWVLALLSGGWLAGALIGAVFGIGRSIFPLAAGWIDRPSRLVSFSRSLAAAATPVARITAVGFIAVALATGVGRVM